MPPPITSPYKPLKSSTTCTTLQKIHQKKSLPLTKLSDSVNPQSNCSSCLRAANPSIACITHSIHKNFHRTPWISTCNSLCTQSPSTREKITTAMKALKKLLLSRLQGCRHWDLCYQEECSDFPTARVKVRTIPRRSWYNFRRWRFGKRRLPNWILLGVQRTGRPRPSWGKPRWVLVGSPV
jgi:hypothetical protein